MSETDPRLELARDYVGLEVPAAGPSQIVRAGDAVTPWLRGWILALSVTKLAAGARLRASLHLRYPRKVVTERKVDRVDVGWGGTIFVPWPAVSLLLEHDAVVLTPATATVSFFPVLTSDPAPSGVGSVLYGRTHTAAISTIPAAPTVVPVPNGATEWRFLPGEKPAPSSVTVRAASDTTIWSEVTYDAGTAVGPGSVGGEAAWQQVPPFVGSGGAVARIELHATAACAGTVFWKYDLGALR